MKPLPHSIPIIGDLGAPESTLIAGIVSDYASLPNPLDHTGELWYVSNPSGGFLSFLGIYKYPKGIYSPNDSDVWELLPLNVKVAEDSTTFVNISVWSDFFNYVTDINSGDEIIYLNVHYRNKTGDFTSTPPPSDGTNWERVSPANTITVAKSGGDFTSLKDAIDSIAGGTKTTVLVYPGIYSENNPIQGKSEVTVQAAGGPNTVEIQAANPGANLFNAITGFFLKEMTFSNVSGVGVYAISHNTPGVVLADDIIIENCSNGFLLNNIGAQAILRNIAFQGTLTECVCIQAGNAAGTILSVVGNATINTMINISGPNSRINAVGLITESINLTTAIFADNGAQVSGSGDRILNCYDGIVLQGNNTQLRLDGLQMQNTQNDGFRINNIGTGILLGLFATSIFDSVRYNFNVENPNSIVLGNGFTQVDKSFIVDGAQFYAYLLDLKEADEALKIISELHVGTSMRPSESVFGGGDSHTFEYVFTFDGVSTYTDQTEIAASPTSSTFSFDGVAAGNMIYIANRFPITFEGIKIALDSAADIGGGKIIAEFWNGSTWEELNGCTVKSGPGFLKYAKNYFSQAGSYHIKYNPFIRDDWMVNDPVGLGEDFYWMRYHITTAITTSPVIQQIKIHTDRFEINVDGTREAHMDARVYKKLTVDAVRPIEGNMQNASIYVDENVGVGLDNNRFTTAGDLLGVSFELPEDCDTSAPIIFVWKGKFATPGDVNFTVRRKIVKPGDPYTNAEPGPSGGVLTETTGTITITAADTREDFRVDLDISDAIPSRENGFGDEIWITIQYPTRGAGNFDYTKLSANYLSDFAGRHVRQ